METFGISNTKDFYNEWIDKWEIQKDEKYIRTVSDINTNTNTNTNMNITTSDSILPISNRSNQQYTNYPFISQYGGYNSKIQNEYKNSLISQDKCNQYINELLNNQTNKDAQDWIINNPETFIKMGKYYTQKASLFSNNHANDIVMKITNYPFNKTTKSSFEKIINEVSKKTDSEFVRQSFRRTMDHLLRSLQINNSDTSKLLNIDTSENLLPMINHSMNINYQTGGNSNNMPTKLIKSQIKKYANNLSNKEINELSQVNISRPYMNMLKQYAMTDIISSKINDIPSRFITISKDIGNIYNEPDRNNSLIDTIRKVVDYYYSVYNANNIRVPTNFNDLSNMIDNNGERVTKYIYKLQSVSYIDDNNISNININKYKNTSSKYMKHLILHQNNYKQSIHQLFEIEDEMYHNIFNNNF